MTDLDHFVRTHEAAWHRLETLTDRVGRRPASLSESEVEEFLALHRRVASQLSVARSRFDDPTITTHLNRLAGDAHAALHQHTTGRRAAFTTFFTLAFPAAVWHLRRFIVIAALVTFVPAAVMAAWLASSDRALEVAAPEAQRAAYVDSEFEEYYSSEPAGAFATRVFVNNIQVSFLAFGLGVLFCVGTVYILAFNGLNLGVALAVFIVAGQQPKFWGLILPHGLLELTAVVVAGAAGIALGWSVIAPGDLTRPASFSEQGRRSVAVIMGLTVVFIAAGLIEGFVTPSPLPTGMRLAIGALVELAFIAYIVAFGRRAEAEGFTGKLGESRRVPRLQSPTSAP